MRLGIISKDSGQFIGVCGTGILDKVSPPNREIFMGSQTNTEIRVTLLKQRKGLIKFLFDNTNVEELIAIAQIRNLPSNKVIQNVVLNFKTKLR